MTDIYISNVSHRNTDRKQKMCDWGRFPDRS